MQKMEIGGGAEGTAQPSVVYGQYDNNGTWTQKTGLTAVGEPYTNSATGADVTYSKTAVSKGNDTYDITLKIESKTSSTAPGASAIVLVIDISTSMYYCTECGNQEYHKENCSKSTGTSGGIFNRHGSEVKTEDTRLYAAKNASVNFVNSYKGNIENAGRYIQLVAFDGYAYMKLSDWIDVSVAANATEAIDSINRLTPPLQGNGTNLEQGLSKAKSLITSAPNGIAKDKKFAVVLTDGEPNRQGSDSSSRKIKSKTDAAAEDLKSAASVYTVCFGAESTRSDELGMTVGAYLSGTVASNPSNAFNANSAAELNKAFEDIFKSIEQGLSSGFTVTDPMGKYIQLQDASLTDCTINKGTITWTPTTGEVSEKNGVKTYTYTLTYTVKLDTSDKDFVDNKYYPTNGVTTLAFRDGDENITRNFNVPGVKGESPKCTVTYNKGNHGNLADQDDKGNVATSVKLGSATPKAPDVTPDNGWYFTGWDKDIAPTVTEDVTYTAQYAEKKTITVTAKSDTAEYNGSERLVNGFETLEFAIDDETYTVSGLTASASGIDANDYVSKVEGTAVVKDSSGKDVTERFTVNTVDGKLTITPKTVTLTGESAIHTYTGQEIELTKIEQSGLLDGHNLSGVSYSAKGTDARTEPYPGEFSDKDKLVITDAAGKDVTNNYNVVYKPGALTINPIGTVTVTIKGNTDTKVYNGTEQSVTGYDVEISDPKYTRDDFKFTGNDKVYRTDVGTTYMGLKAEQFENKNSNFDNVTFFIENDGYVEVTPRPVTLTSETASKPYDGDPLTRPVVTVTGDGFVDGEATAIAIGSVTNVSDSPVTNTIVYTTTDKFVPGNYNITKAEGKLSITPLAVTVTAKDCTKYVGEKDPAFEATVTGTINNDTVSYTISREAGETAGTYPITPAGAEAQGNYTVTYKAGTLTIKERPYIPPVNPPITDKITVEITGNSDSVVYDGTEHSVKDYTVKISDSRYTEKDFTFSGKALASGVNAGAYEMGLKADQFKNTNARFTNVEFIIKADGVLTITQRPLTITAGSAEGIAPVTCDKYTVEGLATGDKVDSVKITGIQSEPGESPNVASDAVIKNAKGEDVTANYKITYVDGVLKAIEVLNKEIHFNYVIGYTDGTIRPNNDISRAEVATIFFRLLTDEARTQYDKTTSSFSDIKDGAWCCRAVSTLTNMGIIKGYTDGSFQPNKSITRAELATIIARFAKLDVNTKTFSDINGHWAQKSIELAAGNGWINGYTDGTFRPNKSIIRAETFAMINRVLDRQTESVSDLLPTSEMNMWSDNLNENAWYYKDVQEATNYHKCDRVGDSVYEKWTEKVPDIDWASYQI